MKKVTIYIDGYNFFYSLKRSFSGKKYFWLNYKKLIRNILPDDCRIEHVKYFTAYAPWDEEGMPKHKAYVRALQKFWHQIIEWRYQNISKTFKKIIHPVSKIAFEPELRKLESYTKDGFTPVLLEYSTYEEKKTDVNMAIHIVADGLSDEYDIAYILSGDSDIVPAIEMVKKLKPEKQFVSVYLSNTKGRNMKQKTDSHILLKEEDVAGALLPDQIILKSMIIERPEDWREETT